MRRIIGEVRPRFVFVENSPALVSRGLGTVLGDLASLGYDARWGVLGAVDAGAPHKRERIWIMAHSKSERHRERGAAGNFFETHGRQDGQVQPIARGASEQSENMAYTAQELQHGRGDARRRRNEYPDGSREMADTAQIGRGERWAEPARRERGFETVECSCEIHNANETRRQNERIGISSQSEYSRTRMHGAWWRTDPADAENATESGMGRVAHGVASRVDRLACLGNGQVPAVAALAWRTLSGLNDD